MITWVRRPPAAFFAGFCLAILLPAAAAQAATWSVETHQLVAGDFDADGYDDLLIIARDPGGISGLAKTTSSGTGEIYQSWTASYLGIPWANGQVAPLIGNFGTQANLLGDDVFLQRASAGLHYELLSDSSGRLPNKDHSFSNSHLGLTWSQGERRAVAGDFNNDQRTDVFLQSRTRRAPGVAVQASASGLFSSPTVTIANDFGGLRWSTEESLVHAGDFDGDGDSDLLVQARPRQVPVWIPSSTGGWPALTPVAAYEPDTNGIAWSDGSSFAVQTTKWSRNDQGVDWSPVTYRAIVGDFNGDEVDDIFLQPRQSGWPAYLVFFSTDHDVRSGRQVEAPSGFDWSTSAGNIVVGNFKDVDDDPLNTWPDDIYFQAATPGGTSYVVTLGNLAGPGDVTATTNAVVELELQEGMGNSGPNGFVPTPRTAVGSTPGEFAVDPTGAATYRIPIVVPPGVAGVAPDLALAYSSRAGNSIMGVGWAITGLSAITRCAMTFAQDGLTGAALADGVDLDSNDRYCLDGSRLQQVGTSGEYRTEVESYRRVVASGPLGSNTTVVTVQDKAGLTYTYGDAGGSATNGVVVADGTALAVTYGVRRIEDTVGNFMSFTYETSNAKSSFRPNKIQYGGNSLPVASVDFEYEDRPDVQTAYLAGSEVYNHKRLKRIVTYSGSSRVREYVLGYGYGSASNRSLLTDVIECERKTNTCLAATAFAWQIGARGITDFQKFAAGTMAQLQMIDVDGNGVNDYVYTPAPTGQANWRVRLNSPVATEIVTNIVRQSSHQVTLDYDGDGYTDLLERDSSSNVVIARGGNPNISPNGGFFSPVLSGSYSSGSYTITDDEWETAVGADINGDGLDDLVFVYTPTSTTGTSRLRARLGTPTGLNGAYIDTPLVVGTPVSGCSTFTTPRSREIENVRLRPLQFNSDGVTDILLWRGAACEPTGGGATKHYYAWQVYSYDGTDWALTYDTGSADFATTELDERFRWPKILDANGDGLSDLVMYDNASSVQRWKLWVSTGVHYQNTWTASGLAVAVPVCPDSPPNMDEHPDESGYFGNVSSAYDANACSGRTPTTLTLDYTMQKLQKNALVMDYDHDGRSDILLFDDETEHWIALHGSEAGFSSFGFDTGFVPTNPSYSFVADVGGDGLPDVVATTTNYTDFYTHHQRGPLPDLLAGISDGMASGSNDFTQIQYSTLADTEVYAGQEDLLEDANGGGAGAAPEFPYAHLSPTLTVVKQFKVPDGQGSTILTRYLYKGAKQHRQGYGFLGFAEVRAQNTNAGIETTNRYMQRFPWNGMIRSAVQKVPDLSGDLVPGDPGLIYHYWQQVCHEAENGIDPACRFMAPFGNSAPASFTAPIVSETTNSYSKTAGVATRSYFPYLTQSVERKYPLPDSVSGEPNPYKITTATYSNYDSYGNVKQLTLQVTDGSGSGNIHTTETQSYYSNWTSGQQWCLGRLTSTLVTHTSASYNSNPAPSTTAYRVSAFSYDSTSCLLDSETVEPAAYTPMSGSGTVANPNISAYSASTVDGWRVKKAYTFDSYGHRKTEQISDGSGSEVNFPTRTTTTTWSALFADNVKNALNHQESYTWDARYGVKLTLTGPNGLTTTWTYDGFGRQTSEIAPQTTIVKDTAFAWCDQAPCSAGTASYRVTESSSDGSRKITEYDRFRREVFRTTTAATGNDILMQKAYDPLGREFRASSPYRSGDPICWTFRQFDFLDRPVLEWSPGVGNNPLLPAESCTQSTPAYTWTPPSGGRHKTMAYDDTSTVAGQRVTKSVDAGREVWRVTNVMDRLIEVSEAAASGPRIATKYDYDAAGNNIYVKDPDNSVVQVRFDPRDRKTRLVDPDMGTWNYVYNGLGELIAQSDGKLANTSPLQYRTVQTYDVLGRMVERIDNYNESVSSGLRQQTNWIYDYADHGIGKLLYAGTYDVSTTGTFITRYEEIYRYDQLSRPTHIIRRIVDDSTSRYFWYSSQYDDQGRVSTLVYPSMSDDATLTSGGSARRSVAYEYNERGALSKVRNTSNGVAYWTLGLTDALGNVTSFDLGNGLTTTRSYDLAAGYMLSNSTSGTSSTITSEKYEWDNRGNLKKRTDGAALGGSPNLLEEFQYDAYDRLASTTVTSPHVASGTPTQYSNDYYASGRIQNKRASNGNNYFSYVYGTGNAQGTATDAGPHAVQQVTIGTGSRIYKYDDNGNVTSDGTSTATDRTFTWSAFNKPTMVSDATNQSAWSYGPDRNYYLQVNQTYVYGSGCDPSGYWITTTTDYVGDSFERVDNIANQGKVEYRMYIRVGNANVAIHTEWNDSGTPRDDYLHQDHLGSLVAITASDRTLLDRLSYDPWGKRRGAGFGGQSDAWLAWGPNTYFVQTSATRTHRGFTDHEHVDTLNFIHMNGRIYDPEIGRFLSADPIVQFPESTQGLDRYAYVNNNPLSYTDPTGHGIWSAVASVLSFIPGLQPWAALLMVAAGGYLDGGTLKGALFAVASAVAAGGVGDFSKALGLDRVATALTHGLVQGTLGAAQGGKFGAAFAAGAFSSGFGPVKGGKTDLFGTAAGRVFQSAIIGGTASVIGGGKFANGAATGAFVSAGKEWSDSQANGEVARNGGKDLPDKANPVIASHVAVEESDSGTTITVNATVDTDRFIRPSEAKEYVDTIIKFWNGTREYGGKTYTMVVNLELIGSGGVFNKGDLTVSGITNENYPLGYSKPQFGIMYRDARGYASTPAHEFGHILGLDHTFSQPSIMGNGFNNPQRRVTGYDMSRVAGLYSGR